jgi:hypothetical protein
MIQNEGARFGTVLSRYERTRGREFLRGQAVATKVVVVVVIYSNTRLIIINDNVIVIRVG